MIEVDARGLSCPEPMLMAVEAMEQYPDELIRVFVSTTNARDNVETQALKRHRKVDIAPDGYDFILTLSK